ncbi:17.6 kDa class II heat shock protein [Actinidia rufa]|uniref:17.6 kDa class II heat shock protein n=1 Tax=Actinidia rufa TaxID=165716 RepID=A0A7J0FNL0_9ERIC|nr:17.6 kDa class II heat shock protein [Actinidia rufa]
MDLRVMGIDSPIFHALHHVLDAAADDKSSANIPSGAYVRDAKAMAATPADVKEYPNSYVFIVDMPGLKSGDIKVQVEDDRVLLISGERKREEEKEAGAKYVRMERRIGKLMRKFVLPENADTEACLLFARTECLRFMGFVSLAGESSLVGVFLKDGLCREGLMGIDSPIFHILHHALDAAADGKSSANIPSGAYVHDAKAMAATPADVKEYPNSYAFKMYGLRKRFKEVKVK